MVIGCDGRGRQLIGPEHVIARSGTNFPCQCELSLVFRSVTTSTMDSSPASLFNSYEQDFQQILQSIRDKLEGDGADQRGGGLWTPACNPNLTSPCPSRAEEGHTTQSRDGARRS